jgi:HK97 gp10 family phage protein
MVDKVTFQIQGLDSLLGKLENLKYETKKKGGRSALRKAAQLVRDAAKANAQQIDDPQTRADIAANIVERWNSKLNKRTGDLGFRVGVMGGAGGNKTSEQLSGLPGGDTRHFRHLEFGTEKTPAQPFFRRALSENVQAATDVFVKEYEKAIDRAIKRASKKGQVI